MNTLHKVSPAEQHVVSLGVSHQVSKVDAAALKDWLADGEVFLVDVREPSEYEESRISSAFLVSMSRFITAAFPRVPAMKTVVVCQNGFLAPLVRDDLIADGFENVYALDGGITAWSAAGFEVEE